MGLTKSRHCLRARRELSTVLLEIKPTERNLLDVEHRLTIQTYVPLGNNYGDVSPHIKLAISIGCRDLNTGIFQALLERFAEHWMRAIVCTPVSIYGVAPQVNNDAHPCPAVDQA